jgi:hypothetical protein
MFIAPVVEERDINFYFSNNKKRQNVRTLTVVWTRQSDYSNDNSLFSRRTLEYKIAHNNFLSNWLAANDDRRTTTSCISTKHQGWYGCRTESKFYFFFFFFFSHSHTHRKLTYDAMIYGIDIGKVNSIYIYERRYH